MQPEEKPIASTGARKPQISVLSILKLLGLLFVTFVVSLLGNASSLWEGVPWMEKYARILFPVVWIISLIFLVRYTKFFDKEQMNSGWVVILGAGVFGVMASNTSTSLSAWIGSISRKHDYKVVLIGPKDSQDSPHWKSFKAGFEMVLQENGKCCSLGSWQPSEPDVIGYFELPLPNEKKERIKILEKDEATDNEETKGVIRKLINDNDVLAIIGFVTSTKAEIALQIMNEKRLSGDTSLPVLILPMATASKLLEKYNKDGQKPILRLVPSNTEQVELIANEIVGNPKNNGGTNFVTLSILRDLRNNTYSSDLATALRERTVLKKVTVVSDGSIGPGGSSDYVTSFARFKPDYVVFMGMLETGIPLVRQIRLYSQSFSNNWNPIILLSDGSVEKAISSYAQREDLKGIIGFFPQGNPSSQHENVHGRFERPSFTMVGHDSGVLTHEILKAAFGKKTRPNRKDIFQAVDVIKKQLSEKPASIAGCFLAEGYKFTKIGEPQGINFHSWMYDGTNWILRPDHLVQ